MVTRALLSCSMIRSTTLMLGLCGLALVGCGSDVAEPVRTEEAQSEPTAQTQQALTSCTGTPVSSGTIRDSSWNSLGTVTLYYSTATQAICGRAVFTAAHGSFQICATNHTNLSQPPACLSYSASDTVGATPAQALGIGDTGSASVFVFSPTFGSGGTGFFTRMF